MVVTSCFGDEGAKGFVYNWNNYKQRIENNVVDSYTNSCIKKE